MLFFALVSTHTPQVEAATSFGVSRNTIVPDGLVGYWTFDGKNMTNATATDISGQGNDGTLTNMTARSGATIGKLGQALRFDGSTNYINLGNKSIYGPATDFTISAWINQNAIASFQCIFCKDTRQGQTEQFRFSVGESAQGKLRYSAATEGVAGVKLISPLNWHHVVITRSSVTGQLTLYLDGVVDNSAAIGSTPSAPSSPVMIGNRNNSTASEHWNGKIDEVRFYNRAITAKEVQTLYKAGGGTIQKVASETGLIGNWPFDYSNVSGTIARDVSVYNNNASLVNGPILVTGKKGQAMQFDGVNDYAALGVNGQTTNNFSFGAWVKTSATHQIDTEETSNTYGTAGQKYIFDPVHKGADAGAGLSVGTNGISVYEHGSTYMPPLAVYSGNIGTDWNHIFVVYSGKRPYIYLNGVLVRTGLTSSKSLVYSPEFLANNGSTYGPFAGQVDDVRIYNRALSAADIQKIYNEGQITTGVSLAKASGLVGYWNFDGKYMTNATATDASGNGNNGTLTNMTRNGSAVIGKIGQALKLDGVNDYINVTGSPTVQNVSYWIKPTANKYSVALNSSKNYLLNNGLYSGNATASRYVNGALTATESVGSELLPRGTAEPGACCTFNYGGTNGGINNFSRVSSPVYAGTYAWQALVANGGTALSDVYFYSDPVPFATTLGTLYKVQFAVRGDQSFSNASFRVVKTDWSASISPVFSFDITTSWVLHTYYFYSEQTAASNMFFFQLGGQGYKVLYFDDISIKPVTSVSDITNNTWNFVSTNLTAPITASAVGIGNVGSRYLGGTIDDVRFYNRQLSASEIQALYKLGGGR